MDVCIHILDPLIILSTYKTKEYNVSNCVFWATCPWGWLEAPLIYPYLALQSRNLVIKVVSSLALYRSNLILEVPMHFRYWTNVEFYAQKDCAASLLIGIHFFIYAGDFLSCCGLWLTSCAVKLSEFLGFICFFFFPFFLFWNCFCAQCVSSLFTFLLYFLRVHGLMFLEWVYLNYCIPWSFVVGATLVVSGDGRYYSKDAIQVLHVFVISRFNLS